MALYPVAKPGEHASKAAPDWRSGGFKTRTPLRRRAQLLVNTLLGHLKSDMLIEFHTILHRGKRAESDQGLLPRLRLQYLDTTTQRSSIRQRPNGRGSTPPVGGRAPHAASLAWP